MAGNWQEMAAYFSTTPYAIMLGMKVVELEQGYAKVVLPLRPEHNSRAGTPHGGAICSLIEYTCISAFCTLERPYQGVQMNINFIARPVPNDTIYAEARVIHAGKTQGVIEATVRDSDNRLTAQALYTGVVIEKDKLAGISPV
jgi:acyl-CoA thioesterase